MVNVTVDGQTCSASLRVIGGRKIDNIYAIRERQYPSPLQRRLDWYDGGHNRHSLYIPNCLTDKLIDVVIF